MCSESFNAKADVANLLFFYKKLSAAKNRSRSESYCLKLWSRFIKERDGRQCIVCSSAHKISAHHICRKSFLNEAKLQTGNGITLCKKCHAQTHYGFNGKANLNLPMDHESGEKIEILTTLYGLLLKNAIKRNIYYVEFYHLSESVLSKFKMFQGFDPDTKFSGAPLEQAFTIWNQAPLPMIKALFDKNSLSSNELLIHVKL